MYNDKAPHASVKLKPCEQGTLSGDLPLHFTTQGSETWGGPLSPSPETPAPSWLCFLDLPHQRGSSYTLHPSAKDIRPNQRLPPHTGKEAPNKTNGEGPACQPPHHGQFLSNKDGLGASRRAQQQEALLPEHSACWTLYLCSDSSFTSPQLPTSTPNASPPTMQGLVSAINCLSPLPPTLLPQHTLPNAANPMHRELQDCF